MYHQYPKLFFFALASSLHSAVVAQLSCTHGKLYISERDTAKVHIYNLDESRTTLVEETSLTVPSLAGQWLDVTESGKTVSSVYWGTEEGFYLDGDVNFIDTGVFEEIQGTTRYVVNRAPSVVENAFLDCGPVWNSASHNGMVALSCDGSYDSTPQVNSTVYIMDEELFGLDENPLVVNISLQGSHHTFSVPLDEKYFFHSIPTPDRVNRVPDKTYLEALGDTFQVLDYEGNIVRSFDDITDPAMHCSDFHGSSQVGNTFALCCSKHIAVVYYDPEKTAFTSRALSYPNKLPKHRAGSIVGHSMSEYFVADYADWDAEVYTAQLMAFKSTATTISEDNVLVLENGQCQYAFEKAQAKLVLVMTPMGEVKVYSVDPSWELLAETKVGTNITDCEKAMMVSGYGYAFVVEYDSAMVYTLDLHDVPEGRITVSESMLGYVSYSAVVAGVPDGMGCKGDEEHDEDGNGEDEEDLDADDGSYSRLSLNDATDKSLTIQEILATQGPIQSRFIMINEKGSYEDGTTMGLISANNDLVLPNPGRMMGKRHAGKLTGHCVQVSEDDMVCYLNLRITNSPKGTGRISIEMYAPFDISPHADIVITGGTGDFMGIVGRGYTSHPPDDTNGTRMNYHLNYKIVL